MEIKSALRKDRISCRENRYNFLEVPLHWHSYYEIELVADGRGTHTINGHEYPEQPGDAFIMRLNDCHGFRMDTRGHHLVADIPVRCMPHETEELLMLAKGDLFVHLEAADFQQALQLYRILQQTPGEQEFDRLRQRHLCVSLILFLLSRRGEVGERYSQASLRLREIIAYIRRNIHSRLTVQSVAGAFFISREYLCTFFKEHAGITLMEYIRKLRLEEAMELLLNTDKGVLEISELSGFHAVSTFARVFKKEYGMPPSEVRRAVMEETNNDEA